MSPHSFTSHAARPALILGVSAAILSLGLSGCSKPKSGSPNPSQGMPTPASSAAAPPASASANTYLQPQVGECYQFASGDNTNVTVVDCNQPHDAETFHIFQFAGTSYPSEDEFVQESDEICALIFEHYVGKPVEESTLDYGVVAPKAETWAKGDHTVECYVFAKDDSKLTQSVRNSNM